MNIDSLIENPQFYGRRRGRKLSKSGQLAIKYGIDYFIKEEEISNIFNYQKHIVLEIGFGDGENLINSASSDPRTSILLIWLGLTDFQFLALSRDLESSSLNKSNSP